MPAPLSPFEQRRRLTVVLTCVRRGKQLRDASALLGVTHSSLNQWLWRVIGTGHWPPEEAVIEAALEKIEAGQEVRAERCDPEMVQANEAAIIRRRDEAEARHRAREAMWLAREKPALNGRRSRPLSEQVL